MTLLLGSLAGWVSGLLGRFHYVGPFIVLLLSGVGLPLPEEVTLIGSGLLLHQGRVDFLTITVVCGVAILLGDSIPYILGRRYGMAVLRFGWVGRLLRVERIAILEDRFREHGNWVIFTCRFLPGLRIPGYFLAGTMRMSYPRFIALDAAGVLLSVPISIYLGKLFGGSIERLESQMDNLHLVLGFGVVTLALVIIYRARVRKRERQVARLNDGAGRNEST